MLGYSPTFGEPTMDKAIEIADDLVKAAQEATGEPDERVAIEVALRGFVQGNTKTKQRPSLSRYAGKFEFAEGYDVLDVL